MRALTKTLGTTFLLLLLKTATLAQITYDWVGTTSTSWSVAANWKTGNTTASTAPSAQTDIIRIGTNQSFSNSPLINTNVTCASIIFGAVNSSLTINSGYTLTVNGDVTAKHGQSNIDGTAFITTLNGAGKMLVKGNFNVGDNTMPPNGTITGVSALSGAAKVIIDCQVSLLTVQGNLAFTSVSNYTAATNNGTGLNDTEFDLNSALTLNGQFKLQDIGATVSTLTPNRNLFYAAAGDSSTVLTLTNTAPIGSFTKDYQYIDFYNANATGHATVIYAAPSGLQTIYTHADGATIGNAPYNYDVLVFDGGSTKVVNGSTLTIGRSFTTRGGTVDLTTNNPAIIIDTAGANTGNWTNSTTVTQGSGIINLNGSLNNSGKLTLGSVATTIAGNFTNSGNFTSGTGSLTFNCSWPQVFTDNGSGTTFDKVFFTGGGAKTITSGNFYIKSTGLIIMASNTELNGNGNLTLMADALSSASIAPVPSGSILTGEFKIQHFVKGSNTNLNKRGYRLITSSVYTEYESGLRVFDLGYLLNDAYVTGAPGGGFNTPSDNASNPSLYLFREDIKPGDVLLSSGPYKSINKIDNNPVYKIGTQSRNNFRNVSDTTVTIPSGNGVLFFFRGNKSDNITQTGTKTTPPYDFPEDVTFTQTGTPNTGTVDVALWYKAGSTMLGYTTSSLNNSLIRGYCLVGNPYASTINWEKFNRAGNNSSIYGANFPAAGDIQSAIWIFNPDNKQYEVYKQKAGPISTADTTTVINPANSIYTGTASNMIASGQGFFIRATKSNQSLSFREQAKTTVQPTFSTNPVSTPNKLNATSDPLLRLKLSLDTINNDEVIIAFADTARMTYNENEDVEDLGGNGALESLSLITPDSIKLAINKLPFPKSQAELISISVNAVNSGTYHLAMTEVRNMPPLYEVWLKDGFTKDSVNMKSGKEYTFTIDKGVSESYGDKRFTLVIRQNTTLLTRLVDFKANKTSEGSKITWTVANEASNTTYTVERSTGKSNTFDPIGTVYSSDAKMNSLVDRTPATGLNNYRLKQMDLNGNVSYSSIAPVMYNNNTPEKLITNISVSPNPATDIIRTEVQAPGEANVNYKINIANSLGKVLISSTSSQPYWQNNVSNFLPGTYIMQVINAKDNSLIGIKKFIKK